MTPIPAKSASMSEKFPTPDKEYLLDLLKKFIIVPTVAPPGSNYMEIVARNAYIAISN